MMGRKLEGPGSAERLQSVKSGFQRASRRLRWRDRARGWGALSRAFAAWLVGLTLFALAAILLADWLG